MSERNVLELGAVGDGVTDDTAALQRALDVGPGDVYFPPLVYRINPGVGLRVGSNRALWLEGATIRGDNVAPRSRLLETIPGARGVRIFGGHFIGQRTGVVGLTFAQGIRFDSVEDAIAEDVKVEGCFTDGFYVGGNDPCLNVALRRVTATRNCRAGLSVCNALRMVVEGSVFSATEGKDPNCGANLEPNHSGEYVEDVTLLNCVFAYSAKGLYIHRGRGRHTAKVKVIGSTFNENAQYHLIGSAVDRLKVLECRFFGGLFGASIGHGSSELTFTDSEFTGVQRPIVLAGVRNPHVYGNRGGTPEQLPTAGSPGAYGDVVMLRNA